MIAPASGSSPSAQPVPRSPEVAKFLYENAFLGQTIRYRQLDRYEAHYCGLQYSHHRLDWWGFSADQMETISPEVIVPYGYTQPAIAASVREKRPTAPFQLCTSVVDRFTGLLFSDTRRPEVFCEGDPDTEDFLLAVTEQCRFWAKMREARTIGGAVGSVLVTVHVDQGRFSVEAHNPKHIALIKWDDYRTFRPAGILKQYTFLREEDEMDPKTGVPTGRTTMVEFMYRRIITDTEDIVFKPARLQQGAAIEWEIASETQHNLGVFPGVWIQNLPVLEDYDGRPDCDGAWQNFDTIDRQLSQMNKALLLNLDPTVVLKVNQKIMEMGVLRKGSDNALNVDTDGDAKYMEMAGTAIEKAAAFVKQLVDNTLHVVRCVLIDPGTISGAAQSAKAMDYLYQPMLEKADDLRAQYGDLGVRPLLELIVRMAKTIQGRDVKLEDGTVAKEGFDLPPRIVEKPLAPNAAPNAVPERERIERKLGEGGYIRLKWGAYFAPTENDREIAVRNLVALKTSGMMDQETAIRLACALYQIKDPQQVLRRIREDEEQQLQRVMANEYGGGGGFGGGGGDDEGGDGAPPATPPAAPDPGEERDPSAGAGGKP